MQFSRFYSTNLQHLFPYSCFIHIQGSWYLTVFSLRIFNFYLLELFFHFCFSLHHYFPNSQNPRQSTVIVQGREEGVYFNKAQWSAACSHFFSTCILKLPFQTMTLASHSLPHPHISLNAPCHILLRKKTNTNLLSSILYRRSDKSMFGFHQSPFLHLLYLLTSPTHYLVLLSSFGSDSLASHHSQ